MCGVTEESSGKNKAIYYLKGGKYSKQFLENCS